MKVRSTEKKIILKNKIKIKERWGWGGGPGICACPSCRVTTALRCAVPGAFHDRTEIQRLLQSNVSQNAQLCFAGPQQSRRSGQWASRSMLVLNPGLDEEQNSRLFSPLIAPRPGRKGHPVRRHLGKPVDNRVVLPRKRDTNLVPVGGICNSSHALPHFLVQYVAGPAATKWNFLSSTLAAWCIVPLVQLEQLEHQLR